MEEITKEDKGNKEAKYDPKDEENFDQSKIILFQGHQDWEGLPGTNYVKSIGGEIIKPEYYSKLNRSSIRDKLNNINEQTSFDIESYILGDISYFPLYNSTKANTLISGPDRYSSKRTVSPDLPNSRLTIHVLRALIASFCVCAT